MDASTYDSIGYNITGGKGFSMDGLSPTSLYPVYPLFLSVVYALFGHNYFAVQLFLSLFMASSCVLIYLIGTLLFGEKPAGRAANFLALYPPFFGLSRIMYAEPVLFIFFYSSILLLIYFFITGRLGFIIWAGVMAGIAILSKPYIIYYPLVISVLLLMLIPDKRMAVRAFFVFNFFIAVAMSPWILRNYLVFKDFRPVSFFSIKAGKIRKVDIATSYDKKEAARQLELLQEQLISGHYARAGIKAAPSREKSRFQTTVDYFGSDYTGTPHNFIDLVRRIYITSYGDILDVSIPFKAFSDDVRLLKKYIFVFLIKFSVMAASLCIFVLGAAGMVFKMRGARLAVIPAALFVTHTVFFYFWVFVWGQVGICGRYGIAVLPLMLLFACAVITKNDPEISQGYLGQCAQGDECRRI